MNAVVPGTILGVGLVLVAGMVWTEGEPGALPLLLVVVGAVWCALARLRARPRRR